MTSPACSLPLRRTDALACQQAGEETLLYDERNHQAYCLDATASLIWQHCDGAHSLEQLAAMASPGSDALAARAIAGSVLARLAKDSLITGYMPPALPVVSRRTMLAQGGAGLALLLPVIATITTPSAAQAYGGCFDCTNSRTAAQRRRLTIEQQRKSLHFQTESPLIQPIE